MNYPGDTLTVIDSWSFMPGDIVSLHASHFHDGNVEARIISCWQEQNLLTFIPASQHFWRWHRFKLLLLLSWKAVREIWTER